MFPVAHVKYVGSLIQTACSPASMCLLTGIMQANDNSDDRPMMSLEEMRLRDKARGIHWDRKNNPSTSSGRYFYPRWYYEGDPGWSGPGVPLGLPASVLEEDAETVLAARVGVENFRRDDSNGWFLVGSVRIHPDDTTVAMYSDTVLGEDPNVFVPEPSEHDNGVVTKWGVKDFTTNHDFLASAIMRQENVRMELYGKEDNHHPTLQFIKVLEQRKLKCIDSGPVQVALHSTYVLKLQLCENENDIWRRIRVPAAIDLSKFDDQVICPVMGWSRSYKAHVFEDPKDGAVLGSYPSKGQYPSHMDAFVSRVDNYHTMDDRNLPLALLLRKVGDFAYYTHDLAEQWVHIITLEEILQHSHDDGSVSLLDGKGACPPEDGKGIAGRGCLGYAEFLRAYKKNPRKLKMKEAVREMKTAYNHAPSIGSRTICFNPFNFDIHLQRQILEAAIAGPSLRIKGPLGSTTLKESFSGCASCGNRLKAVLLCSRCGKVGYCSRECQVVGWNEGDHKKVCKRKDKGSKNRDN